MFSLSLSLELIPNKKEYRKLLKLYKKLQKREPEITWELYVDLISERITTSAALKAAKGIAKEFTSKGK